MYHKLFEYDQSLFVCPQKFLACGAVAAAVGSKEIIDRRAYDNGYYYGERAVEVETEAVKLFGGEVACNERKYKYR